MMNNTALKATLNQKAAEAAQKNPALLTSTRGNSIEHQPFAHSLTSPSVTVSFTLPLEEAAGFLERVRSCLPIHSGVKQVVASPLAEASAPVRTPEPARPIFTQKISDKQLAMIASLCKRKHLTNEQTTSMLQARFGVAEGGQLDRKQASQLIGELMAQ
jgi:hypothetical protein